MQRGFVTVWKFVQQRLLICTSLWPLKYQIHTISNSAFTWVKMLRNVLQQPVGHCNIRHEILHLLNYIFVCRNVFLKLKGSLIIGGGTNSKQEQCSFHLAVWHTGLESRHSARGSLYACEWSAVALQPCQEQVLGVLCPWMHSTCAPGVVIWAIWPGISVGSWIITTGVCVICRWKISIFGRSNCRPTGQPRS